MATNGEIYHKHLEEAKMYLDLAEKATTNGDLWNADIHLRKAAASVDEANNMIRLVSKTAFERVFKEKG